MHDVMTDARSRRPLVRRELRHAVLQEGAPAARTRRGHRRGQVDRGVPHLLGRAARRRGEERRGEERRGEARRSEGVHNSVACLGYRNTPMVPTRRACETCRLINLHCAQCAWVYLCRASARIFAPSRVNGISKLNRQRAWLLLFQRLSLFCQPLPQYLPGVHCYSSSKRSRGARGRFATDSPLPLPRSRQNFEAHVRLSSRQFFLHFSHFLSYFILMAPVAEVPGGAAAGEPSAWP